MGKAPPLLASLCAVFTSACAGGPEDFNRPTDIAFAKNGDVFIADGYGNSRVAKFSPDGTFLLEWGDKGMGPGQFHTPHGITTDADDRVYVADRGNARVQVFDADGTYLTEWRSKELGRPWAITFGADSFMYVVDGGDQNPERPRGRLVKLDLQGNVIERWSSSGLGLGQIDDGHDIGVGSDGSVYVVDIKGKRVQKFQRKTSP